MYGIWCEVNGRMGYRQNWLKRGDGEIAEFLTNPGADDAETDAEWQSLSPLALAKAEG